jgi:hypothetical protein
VNQELRGFAQRLIAELDKIVDNNIKVDGDLWIAYDVYENDLDMSFFVKHRLGHSLYFSGKLETIFIKIVYEKVEGYGCDMLNIVITLKDNLGITHLNTHTSEIAFFIKSLIEM